jgi:hypothetical protein
MTFAMTAAIKLMIESKSMHTPPLCAIIGKATMELYHKSIYYVKEASGVTYSTFHIIFSVSNY